MSYKIDFGGWGSVFAVPTALVDKGLKLASETQLKVLLYILRNSDRELTDELVANAISVHPEDVRDAITYWTDMGLLASLSDSITMGSASADNSKVSASEQVASVITEDKPSSETKPRPVSRAVKPEPGYVSKRLKTDKNLVLLMDEAQRILSKVFSNSDTATLIMLHDTDGLPVEVILMLLEHCVQIGKGNMRYIERTGIQWASEGITTINLAEEKIRRYSESTTAWNTVAAVFGIRLTGTPTKNQLSFADTWVNQWSFTEDMLRLAYESCVDSKGEMKLPYINAILRKWHEAGFTKPQQVAELNSTHRNKKKPTSETASYDLDAYESKSLFDD